MKLFRKKTLRPQKPANRPHMWTADEACKMLVLAAWDKLLKDPKSARSVPGYLRGIANVQEKRHPDKASGLRELVRDARAIVEGDLKPYSLKI